MSDNHVATFRAFRKCRRASVAAKVIATFAAAAALAMHMCNKERREQYE